MRLEDITTSMLVQAMDIYLQHAYRHRSPSDSVCILTQIDRAADLATVLSTSTKADAPDRPGVVQKYRWRLGNDRYPHMQLGLDRCGSADDFVFVVDTHDRNFPLGSPALQDPAFHDLLAYNERLKHAIEAAWVAADLPTLHVHLQRRIGDRCTVRPGRPKTILVVDDDASILELEAALLEGAGYRVLTAAGGLQALRHIDTHLEIDCCLVDIMMPGMDGMAVARKARHRVGSDFPIIYVTALPPDRARDGVADDYVGKPFDPDQLLDVIQRHTA